ncbi:MAG TPA: hypothetical protein VFS49_10465 [Croceibacterium sp.]|nr:hypothetical protein [Croceibacterium sp.]
MTTRLRPALVAALAVSLGVGAASAQGQGEPQHREGRDRERDYRRADPAAVIAAEIAFARAAQDKGQWTAFAEYATKDALMFLPQPSNAQAWLKGRANPAQAVRWQPHQVWSSCDGSLAVTKGAWQRPDGSVGYFTTVWERQKKQKDGYRWVLDQGDALAEPLAAPEMIAAKSAECPRPIPRDEVVLDPPQCTAQGCTGGGRSGDGTLAFRYETAPDGARTFRVLLRNAAGEMDEVLRSEVAAG